MSKYFIPVNGKTEVLKVDSYYKKTFANPIGKWVNFSPKHRNIDTQIMDCILKGATDLCLILKSEKNVYSAGSFYIPDLIKDLGIELDPQNFPQFKK